jgi:hypothetical protein
LMGITPGNRDPFEASSTANSGNRICSQEDPQ